MFCKVETEEQYNKLTKWAESKGYTWTSGSKYSELNLYRPGEFYDFVKGYVTNDMTDVEGEVFSYNQYRVELCLDLGLSIEERLDRIEKHLGIV